ncbi:AlpA family phage regulatory protein [Ectopseudomonas mendocina]|nr:AlpA family phage regulatory protein [Pseudomonas mendocina]
MVGLSRSQIYRLMKAGKFPASISLGTYSVAWSAEQVHAWVEEKISASAR